MLSLFPGVVLDMWLCLGYWGWSGCWCVKCGLDLVRQRFPSLVTSALYAALISFASVWADARSFCIGDVISVEGSIGRRNSGRLHTLRCRQQAHEAHGQFALIKATTARELVCFYCLSHYCPTLPQWSIRLLVSLTSVKPAPIVKPVLVGW